MSDHFYPLSIETLLKSSELVASAGLPFVIGEIGWTKEDTLPFLEAVEVLQDDGLVAGDLFWSMFGHAETLGHVTHNDGYSIYWPTGPEPESFHHNNPAYRSLMKNFSDHMFTMRGQDIPDSYFMADDPPVITNLECNPQQWISIGVRGVAGAHLYSVFVDGQPIAILEDKQTSVTYIHNDIVMEDSEVVVLPLSYLDMREGTPSDSVSCSSDR